MIVFRRRRSIRRLITAAASIMFILRCVSAQEQRPAEDQPVLSKAPRIGVSAGMGVDYVNAQDIVDLVNNSGLVYDQLSNFKAGVEFFGSVSVPIDGRWGIKGEYAYLLASYNPSSAYGSAEITMVGHLPTLIVQYFLWQEALYNLKLGVGGGYHVGILKEVVGQVNTSYTATGFGTILDGEGNTALGEHLFAYLGVFVRWDSMGTLKDENGHTPAGLNETSPPTFHFFGVGARLGFTYYF